MDFRDNVEEEIAKIKADLTRPLINLYNIQQQAIDAAEDVKAAAEKLNKLAGRD